MGKQTKLRDLNNVFFNEGMGILCSKSFQIRLFQNLQILLTLWLMVIYNFLMLEGNGEI